ncbi:MAG: hypothetical protein IPQ15_02585 [Betaproteobacteria bacterium]|nr:hypothetical protein [Betaproteobacteria bacterium]
MIRTFVAAGFALSLLPAAQTVTTIEYYHAEFDHFFVSSLGPTSTPRFGPHPRLGDRPGLAAASAAANLDPVCRFYIPPAKGDSHFFSASVDECATVLGRIGVDPNYAGYVYESPAAWFTALPDTASGACPVGMVPVWRLWNRRVDSNHRYTAQPGVRGQMLGRGYVAEATDRCGSACAAHCSPAGRSPQRPAQRPTPRTATASLQEPPLCRRRSRADGRRTRLPRTSSASGSRTARRAAALAWTGVDRGELTLGPRDPVPAATAGSA